MEEVKLHTARTANTDVEAAADELVAGLGRTDPKLVMLFADRARDQLALNQAVRKRLGDKTRLLGASSGGEIDKSGIHGGTAVLGAFDGDFELGIGFGKSLSKDAVSAGASAMKQACAELGTKPRDLDTSRHIGLVIDDGFRFKKEELLLGVLDKNQGMLLVGGGASDSEQDPTKQSAQLHVDGEVATDSALVCLFETSVPFAALRHHAYTPTGQTMTITKVSDDGNRALEINGKPAAKEYAATLGVAVDDLEFGKPNGFSKNPLALKVGREHFLRSPWKPLEDGSILFANLLEDDSTYDLMEIGDMAALTKEYLSTGIAAKVPNPSAAVHFHCSGRNWLAHESGTAEALSEAFQHGPPSVGFNVFFEIYCGFQINTTLTSLVFGQRQ